MRTIRRKASWLGASCGVAVAFGATVAACSSSSPSTTPDAASPNDGAVAHESGPDVVTPDSGPDVVTPDSGPDAVTPDSGPDAVTPDGGAADVTQQDGNTDASDGGGCVTLTVKNYFNWCSVSVNGGTASNLSSQTVCVPSGTTVSLAATPLSSFQLGPAPWHDTAGDTGSGDPGTVSSNTSSTTVVVSPASTCVWVCCPFSPNGNGCPPTNQCP
jgi:hypothetical protein